jgi:hypothetical protein
MYQLHLAFKRRSRLSDTQDVDFGIRKITYSLPGTDTLTISVNGVPIFIRGGDWGLDEAMKRIPRERLDAQIHMHQLAHLNLIRNWVGQSTGEDFYELCDKYGILVWDEFFQPNPCDGPDPTDLDTYIANVRDKILRFRNHPSIMLVVRAQRGFSAAGDRRASAQGAGRARAHAPLSAEFDRWPRRALARALQLAHAARVLHRHRRLLQNRNRQRVVPTLESIHGMMPKKGLGDDQRRLGRARSGQGRSGGDLTRPFLPGATARSPTSPTLCARRSWPTTRPSAPCTKGAMRSSSIPPRPSSRG